VQPRLAYDRTYLANERTYAAWLRTGLAVAAGGIAVAHLVPRASRDAWIALELGSAFVAVGVSVTVDGARQFTRTTAALVRESGRAPPITLPAASSWCCAATSMAWCCAAARRRLSVSSRAVISAGVT
jgi:uncharacterized membrane protein YidH (DUF202 family)